MLHHRWLPALNRARRGGKSAGWWVSRTAKGTNTEAGRQPEQEKHFSTSANDGWITTTPLSSPPPSKGRACVCWEDFFFITWGAKQEQNIKKNALSNYSSRKGRVAEDCSWDILSSICCSFLLSVGNRFLVSIQQHKMSLSGGSRSDEYIHLHSLSVCLCVHTKACEYIFMNVSVSLLLNMSLFYTCVWACMHGCTGGAYWSLSPPSLHVSGCFIMQSVCTLLCVSACVCLCRTMIGDDVLCAAPGCLPTNQQWR